MTAKTKFTHVSLKSNKFKVYYTFNIQYRLSVPLLKTDTDKILTMFSEVSQRKMFRPLKNAQINIINVSKKPSWNKPL